MEGFFNEAPLQRAPALAFYWLFALQLCSSFIPRAQARPVCSRTGSERRSPDTLAQKLLEARSFLFFWLFFVDNAWRAST